MKGAGTQFELLSRNWPGRTEKDRVNALLV